MNTIRFAFSSLINGLALSSLVHFLKLVVRQFFVKRALSSGCEKNVAKCEIVQHWKNFRFPAGLWFFSNVVQLAHFATYFSPLLFRPFSLGTVASLSSPLESEIKKHQRVTRSAVGRKRKPPKKNQ